MVELFLPHRSRIRFATATSEMPSRAAEATTTWTGIPGGVISGGEIILLAVKPSVWRPVLDSAPWVLAVCLLATFLTNWRVTLPTVSETTTVQLVLLIGLLRLGFAVLRWVPTWYILTNRRVIDVQGIRAPRVTSCSLLDIRNTYLNASFPERLASLGTITFVTDQPEIAPSMWQSIAQPDDIHAKIRRAIENAIDQFGVG